MVESNGLVPSCRIQRRWLGKGLPQSQKGDVLLPTGYILQH